MLDKITGALVGLAIGDALGATTEFMTEEEIKDAYGRVDNIVGGGYWQLKPGEVTDDTEMTIAVIKGIMANSGDPIEEIGKQFLHWQKSNPVDIGLTIRMVLQHYQGDWFGTAKKVHDLLNGKSAGNGSLMRCLPFALAYSDKGKMRELTVRHSKMTHFDELAAEACVIYNFIAKRVLEGEDLKTAIITEIKDTRYDISYEREPDCPADGFVVHSMKWVLYWLLTSDSFVTGAANKGGDSDTIAAIAGGLKGLEVGFEALPISYKNALLCLDTLKDYGAIIELIRDKDTMALKAALDGGFADLAGCAKMLYAGIEQGAVSQAEKEEFLEEIRKAIWLSRISFKEDDLGFEDKRLTWRMLSNRYFRSRRLVVLGHPKSLFWLNWSGCLR